MKASATEGTEELFFTFRVGALDTSDSLCIAAAGDEVLHHFRDALQAETPVCGSILFFIVVCILLEVLLEDGLKYIRSALSICRGWIRIELKR